MPFDAFSHSDCYVDIFSVEFPSHFCIKQNCVTPLSSHQIAYHIWQACIQICCCCEKRTAHMTSNAACLSSQSPVPCKRIDNALLSASTLQGCIKASNGPDKQGIHSLDSSMIMGRTIRAVLNGVPYADLAPALTSLSSSDAGTVPQHVIAAICSLLEDGQPCKTVDFEHRFGWRAKTLYSISDAPGHRHVRFATGLGVTMQGASSADSAEAFFVHHQVTNTTLCTRIWLLRSRELGQVTRSSQESVE